MDLEEIESKRTAKTQALIDKFTEETMTDSERLYEVINDTNARCSEVKIDLTAGTDGPVFRIKVHEKYKELFDVLLEAYNQAAIGKGKDRHANNKPFVKQPILEIARMVGDGYLLGQAMKKTQEASRLPTTERKVNELLGAINYLAAVIIYYRENEVK